MHIRLLLKTYLCEIVNAHPFHYTRMLNSVKSKWILEQINKLTPKLQDPYYTLVTKVYWILNDIYDFPKCGRSCCNNKILKNVNQIYNAKYTYCSNECNYHSEDKQIRTRKTKLDRYGNEFYYNSEQAVKTHRSNNNGEYFSKESIQKISDTKINRYNDPHYVNVDKARKTRYSKNNGQWHNDTFVEKCKETSLNNFGVEYWMMSDFGKEYMRLYNLTKYGVSCYFNTDDFKQKSKNTCNKNYGVDYYVQTKEFTQRLIQHNIDTYGVEYPMMNEEFKNNFIQNFIIKYGVKCPSQLPDFKEKCEKTYMNRFGVTHPMKDPQYRAMIFGKYKYNGLLFDSSYELMYYIYNCDHNIVCQRSPNIKFNYEYNGIDHIYEPDFLVNCDIVEIKGLQFFKCYDDSLEMICPYNFDTSEQKEYMDGLYEAKHQCMLKNNVKILTDNSLKHVFDYFNTNYEKDYIKQFKTV